MNLRDEEIVNMVRGGAIEEFARLIQRYENQIYSLMFRFTSNEQEAAELTQDVFLLSYKKLDSLDSGKKFFTWLYSIAINRAKDWKRKKAREWRGLRVLACLGLGANDQAIYEPSEQERRVEQTQDSQRISRALEMLPPEKREVLILRYTHERSIREIAEIFSLSESAVKMRIKRGLEYLHSALAGDFSTKG